MNATLKNQYNKLSEIQQEIFQAKAEIKALKWREKRLRKEIERIEKIPEEVREKLSDRYVKYIFDDDNSNIIRVEFIHLNELLSTKCSYSKNLLYNNSVTVIDIHYKRDTKEIKFYYYQKDCGVDYDPSKLVDVSKEEFESYLLLKKQFTDYGN